VAAVIAVFIGPFVKELWSCPVEWHISYCGVGATGTKLLGGAAAAERGVGRGVGAMAVVLLILGIVVATCGVAAMGLGFTIPLNEFTLGATLFSGGTTALTGGLILIGLSAVVSELARFGDSLKKGAARPAQRSGETLEPAPAAVSASPATAPAPRVPTPVVPLGPRSRLEVQARDARPATSHPPSPSSVEVSAAAIERLRSTIPRTEAPRVEPPIPGPQVSGPLVSGSGEEAPLSPNGAAGGAYQSPGRARAEPAAPEPRVAAEDRPGGAVEALKASRLDFLFRSKSARPAPQGEDFEAVGPAGARAARTAAPTSEAPPTPQPVERQPATDSPVREPKPQPTVPEASAATILKSGVVDGMAYTLYTDGSIEAKLPQGTIRFGSVAELRAHIESNS
jgi:hypothetical protein